MQHLTEQLGTALHEKKLGGRWEKGDGASRATGRSYARRRGRPTAPHKGWVIKYPKFTTTELWHRFYVESVPDSDFARGVHAWVALFSAEGEEAQTASWRLWHHGEITTGTARDVRAAKQACDTAAGKLKEDADAFEEGEKRYSAKDAADWADVEPVEEAKKAKTLGVYYRDAEAALLRAAAKEISKVARGHQESCTVAARRSAALTYKGQDSGDLDLEFNVTLIAMRWPGVKVTTWGKGAMIGSFSKDVTTTLGAVTPDLIVSLFQERF